MLTEDDLNHLVVLNVPENGYVEYYFMATWELEWQPVNNITDFMNALDEELIRLNGLSYLKVSEKILNPLIKHTDIFYYNIGYQ